MDKKRKLTAVKHGNTLAAFPKTQPKRSHKRKPEPVYAPGHYLELVHKHQWPPNFVPRAVWGREAQISRQASDARGVAVRNGTGWATGTIRMAGTPNWKAPGMMK